MNGSALRFALGSLAVWRVAHLLTAEDGPLDVVVHLRARAGSGLLGDLMDCFQCLSIWVAAPISFAIVERKRDAPLTWLALSGAACLLERAAAAQPLEELVGDEHDPPRPSLVA
jgi:uncharacterized protein DUF1360